MGESLKLNGWHLWTLFCKNKFHRNIEPHNPREFENIAGISEAQIEQQFFF